MFSTEMKRFDHSKIGKKMNRKTHGRVKNSSGKLKEIIVRI